MRKIKQINLIVAEEINANLVNITYTHTHTHTHTHTMKTIAPMYHHTVDAGGDIHGAPLSFHTLISE